MSPHLTIIQSPSNEQKQINKKQNKQTQQSLVLNNIICVTVQMLRKLTCKNDFYS